ncbi:MAG: DUF1554 domain-containing protein [bacterium]
MKKYFIPTLLTVMICLYSGVSGCGNNGYKVGGAALGLDDGDKVVLQVNLKNSLTVDSNAPFTFTMSIPDKTFYNVTAQAVPSGKICSVANNEGYISGSSINNVDVMCSVDPYTVGGTVTGLDLGGSLVIQNNQDDDFTITSNGAFTFPTELADNAEYDVTILTNNSGKTCNVTNGKDIIMGADVTNVVIVCNSTSFSVGGTVTGIPAGKELILQNSLQNDMTLTADGAFTFSTKVPNTGGYHVSVLKEPAGTNCTVTNGTGVIGGADVNDVEVTCVASPALIMFLSSYSVPSGYIGGIRAADAYCQRDCHCPRLGTCKAMIVDGPNRVACRNANCSYGAAEHLDWVLQANRTYVMPDKTTVIGTTNDNGIFPFPLTNIISDRDKYVWTGLNADWTIGNSCDGWYTKSSSKYGNMGYTNVEDDSSIYSTSGSASTCRYSRGYLYCVEQPD